MDILHSPEVHDVVRTLVLAAIGALGSVLSVAVTVIGKKAARWVESRSHSAAFGAAVERITTLTAGAVEEVEQTLVRRLKRETRWGPDTARMARDTAVRIVKRQLGERGMKELQRNLGQAVPEIESIIRTHVERYVRAMGTLSDDAPIVDLEESVEARE